MKTLIRLALLTAALAAHAADRGQAEHIIVVVWDGMRPDFITPQHAPNLYSLATNGVFFKRHHPAYISTTEVNGTAIATGTHPERSGIIANSDYRPMIGWLGVNATEGVEAIRSGDFLTGGHYLLVPTVAETLQKHGIPTIIAGTKPVALLHDRALKKPGEAGANSVTLYNGTAIPRSALEGVEKVNDDKKFPTNTIPNKDRDVWTTKGLTRSLWRKAVPKYTLLWLSEPDASQHENGPGSPNALAAIDSSDKQLGEVLKTLEEKKIRDQTDILIVSDHGFSTIFKGPDVVDILKKAKFRAFKKFEDPEKGDVLVVPLGGSICFYVFEQDEGVARRLAEFLQSVDFSGVVFSRIDVPGTFPISTVRMDPTNVHPDVVISMRWTADRNDHGTPGMIWSDGGTKGKGTHGSLSRYDMNNTLVASGPGFKRGLVSEVPSGNIDVAPTVLHLLGVTPDSPMDGRVLHEALANSSVKVPTPETKTLEATAQRGIFQWKQYLKISKVGDTVYFDEGNGELTWR